MAKRKTLDKEIIKIVRDYACQLKKAGIDVSKLILFGSQVKGKSKSYSDIDVCVISPQFGQDDIKEAVKLKMLADKVDWRIEPHPYHPRDFAIEEDPFAWEIKRTGYKIKV